MTNAEDEVKQQTVRANSVAVDCTVSLDSNWQMAAGKRGHDSQNGLVTAIVRDRNIDKCVDYQILTKKCKACQV